MPSKRGRGVFDGLSFFVHQHHRPTHDFAADCNIITTNGGTLVSSPLIAQYVLVEIPFDHTAPEKRKFYIHQRRSEKSLSNWDRWSRDWTWTLDELMGLAADREPMSPAKARAALKESSAMDDDGGSEEGDIMAVVEEGEILPVGAQQAVPPKQVVQRYWLGECIQKGRILDRDAGWHIDCVEGWQYPQWDRPGSISGREPSTWGEERRRKMGENEEDERWTWGVREDEYGFAFGWRKEPRRVVTAPVRPPSSPTPPAYSQAHIHVAPESQPLPKPQRRGSLSEPQRRVTFAEPQPRAVPTESQPRVTFSESARPRLTVSELHEQDEINRRMNENRRFSFNKKGGLVWNKSLPPKPAPPQRSVSMPTSMRAPVSSSKGLWHLPKNRGPRMSWQARDSQYRRRADYDRGYDRDHDRRDDYDQDYDRRDRSRDYNSQPKSPGRLFRSAAWDLYRQPLHPAPFHVGRSPAPASSDRKPSKSSKKKKKAEEPTNRRVVAEVPPLFFGKTFNDFQGGADGLIARIKRHGGLSTFIDLADYVILRTDPGRTTHATYVNTINRKSQRPRKVGSEVVSVEWIEQSIAAGRLLDQTPYLVTVSPDFSDTGSEETTTTIPPSSSAQAAADDSRKRVRPLTPDTSRDRSRSVEPTLQAPISPDHRLHVSSSYRAPTPDHHLEPTLQAPTPPVERPPTPPPDRDQIMDYEDGLIDLDYDDDNEMMVDLDVHLTLPKSYDWSKIPKIELPSTVFSTHVDGVRILIAELTAWDGEGTKAECFTRIKQKGLLEVEELYGTYRSVIDERVPGLGSTNTSKRAKY